MKNRKIFIILITIILILGTCGIYIYNMIQNNKKENKIIEYTPAEEITEEQLRQTIVSLYFNNKDTNTIIPEPRNVDVKQLMKEPYLTLIKLLIEGPKNEKLEKLIPEGTKVNKIELKNNIIYIDFSKEFIENHEGGVEKESKTIYSIVNTLTQLNEVEAVKIIIEGDEGKSFKDNCIKFNEAFVKKD